MIERKIDADTVMVGRVMKISDFVARKAMLEQQQIDSQAERDAWDALSAEMKEKVRMPIDFTDEIDGVAERIDKYTKAKVGEIKVEIKPEVFDVNSIR